MKFIPRRAKKKATRWGSLFCWGYWGYWVD